MTTHQQIEKALDTAIEELRQTSFVPFWKASINLTPHEELSKLFRNTRKTESRVRGELEEAAEQVRFDSFDLIVTDRPRDYYGNTQGVSIHARLVNGHEWDAALRDAWRDSNNPNEWFLSDNALKMLHWLQGPKNTGEFSSGNLIGKQAWLRGEGCYSEIGTYLKEISLKAPYQVSYQKEGHWPTNYKAIIEPKAEEKIKLGKFSNPVFPGDLLKSDRGSIQDYAEMLKNGVLEASLKDTEEFLLFNIHSRASLIIALPFLATCDDYTPRNFKEFLSKVRLTPGLKVEATFSDSASEGWRLGAVLEDDWTWSRARQAILEQRQRKSPEETYGLSSRAAKIITWILDLHDDEYELGMTPCLEGVAREQIGIDDLSYSQNAGALLTLLTEEINEKTSYALRLIPWRHCGSTYHRILVRRDSGGDEELVRKIQIRGLDKGVNLTSSQVEKVLAQLWEIGSSDA